MQHSTSFIVKYSDHQLVDVSDDDINGLGKIFDVWPSGQAPACVPCGHGFESHPDSQGV
jgi:hypothetical protein